MNVFTELPRGLGNLAAEHRREVYDDLRAALNLDKDTPMLPLPAPELAAWSRRFAEILVAELSPRQSTRMFADRAMLEAGFLDYAKPPSDEFLDSQLALGGMSQSTGISGLYVHTVLNLAAFAGARKAAREVLPAALASVVEERYPPVVLLRHALFLEGARGLSGMQGAEPANSGTAS